MDLHALSPSRINTYKDCEFKYFLTYHLRIPEARESNIYGIKGNAVHEALEYRANAIRGEKENANKNYKQTLKNFYAKTELWKLDNGIRKGKGFTHPVEKYCEACPWATKGGKCSIAKIPFKDVEGCPKPNFEDDLALVEKAIKSKDYPLLDRKILGAEVKYELTIPADENYPYPIVLKGVIDLVTELDSETLEITDYKSGNSTKSYDAARNDPQMRIYSLVAKILWPQYDLYLSSLYYVRKHSTPVTVIFSEEDDKETLRAARIHWKNITENEEPSRPLSSFWLCNYCVGHDRCGQIKENHTKGGQFILPVITCSQKDSKCWGVIKAENPNKVTVYNTDKMTYACEGHFEIHKGGEYVKQPDGD